MSYDLDWLRGVLEATTPGPWHARGQHVSRSDGTGMGAGLPTNHIAAAGIRDDARAIATLHNAAPELLAVADVPEPIASMVRTYRTGHSRGGAYICDCEWCEWADRLDALRAKLRALREGT